jgi:Tfp pilus assembly protein PilO
MGTAALAVLLLLAGWFLLVSPKRAEADDLNQQAARQAADNVATQAKIKVLKAQAANLPQQQAKLATIRLHIPTTPGLPPLVRSLSQIAKDTGVTLKEVSPSNPVAVVSQPGVVAVGETTLQQVPFAITVLGDYWEIERFLSKVEGLQRSFLVTGIDFTLPNTPSTNASATTSDSGVRQAVISGRVFLVQQATAPVAVPGTTGTSSGTSTTPSATPSAAPAQ